MEWERKTIKVGAIVICLAVLLRLLAGGMWDKLIYALTSPRAVTTMLFLETGRVVRPGGETLPTETVPIPAETATEPAVAMPTETESIEENKIQAVFSAADAALVEVRSACGYTADVAGGLTKQLTWDLTGEGPTVLIIHSHGTESYENTEGYQPSSGYRTKDPAYNMISVGDRLVQILEQRSEERRVGKECQ